MAKGAPDDGLIRSAMFYSPTLSANPELTFDGKKGSLSDARRFCGGWFEELQNPEDFVRTIF